MSDNEAKEPKQFSRREFVAGVGGVGAGLVIGGALGSTILLPDQVLAFPASKGYILVDTKKCAGCKSCMIACSLVHYGEASLALSRIRVAHDPFAAFPAGTVQAQCRQCPYPACTAACPTGANHVDTEHGNVRIVDYSKCIGCERCIEACPFEPSRSQWDFEQKHAQKCDLCVNAPFMTEKGGPGGHQACVDVCPMHAISFSADVPVQSGDVGYQVNLRAADPVWKVFGFPTGDNGEFTSTPIQTTSAG